jgi:hypothetical protein
MAALQKTRQNGSFSAKFCMKSEIERAIERQSLIEPLPASAAEIGVAGMNGSASPAGVGAIGERGGAFPSGRSRQDYHQRCHS